MDIAKFKKQPILGILRGIELIGLEPLLETIISSGLKTIEITMNTLDAPQLIRRAAKFSAKRLTVGAGTVLDKKALKSALKAGASFIVMPVFVEEVAVYCLKNKIPFFPGALTPQEIYRAWDKGAAMVKIFPAKFFGPQYFREIRGPFGGIELLACSGVTPQNMQEYFDCGASAVAFGASVFRKDWLKNKDFKSIAAAIKQYTERS
ncbi:MAG: bifunctional 4-hydroxy-2-oxoglutarate aldolase/2-dehydro-3-deoxy-phosphogluconate aldolase [Candidatus Omnitrophota bacterium]